MLDRGCPASTLRRTRRPRRRRRRPAAAGTIEYHELHKLLRQRLRDPRRKGWRIDELSGRRALKRAEAQHNRHHLPPLAHEPSASAIGGAAAGSLSARAAALHARGGAPAHLHPPRSPRAYTPRSGAGGNGGSLSARSYLSLMHPAGSWQGVQEAQLPPAAWELSSMLREEKRGTACW